MRREIEQAEAVVVRQIFELAALGIGYKGISKRLNDERAVCPRPQRGRPAGWAPSSVREVLQRSAYRGEVVWNRSRKRDSWGQHRQTARPAAEWMRISAPDLQIVGDDLWHSARRQMERQRVRASVPTAYQGPKGAKTTYLLTCLLKCSVCGARMEIRRQKHGRVRLSILHCSEHWRKGKNICANSRTVVMADAEMAILDALQDTLLNPDVIEAAVHRAAARLTAGDSTREMGATELSQLDTELARLAAAIAAGGDVPALVEAVRAREERSRELQRQLLAKPTTALALDVKTVLADLRARLHEWLAVLRGAIPEARALIRLLIVDRLTMEPVARGYRFSGKGTVQPILEGAVLPAARLEWRPHRDSVPLARAKGGRRKPEDGWGQPSPEGRWRPHRVPLRCGQWNDGSNVPIAGVITSRRNVTAPASR